MSDSLKEGLSKTRRVDIDVERTISFMGDECRVYATPKLLYDEMTARLMDRGVCCFRNCARGTRALVSYFEARLNAESLQRRRSGGTDL